MVTRNNIPPQSYVIRVKGTNVYIHLNKGEMSIKEKMVGCFVCTEDSAKDILFKLRLLEYEYELEIVDFNEAYKAHGLIEKQIAYN